MEVEDAVLAERIDAMHEVLSRSAAKALLEEFPTLVLHYDLRLTLRPKLEVLTRATGLDAARLLPTAPTLLTLSPKRVGGRLEEPREGVDRAPTHAEQKRIVRLRGRVAAAA